MNDNINNLITTLERIVPENSGFLLTIDGHRISASNHEGSINISIEPVELTYDDSRVKKLVAAYKRNINKLDDCLFLDVLDEIKDHLDLNTFDELLEQESYSEEDAEIVKAMINFTQLVTHEHIVNKIQNLEGLLTAF